MWDVSQKVTKIEKGRSQLIWDAKDGTTRLDLASLTLNGRTINNDVISGNDVIIDNTTIHCK